MTKLLALYTQSLRKRCAGLSYILVCAVLSGCAGQSYQQAETAYSPVKSQLQAHYLRWNGTPYKYGGNSRRGIDCSAFVARTYKDVFDLYLPRTTRAQAVVGEEISRRSARPGDLVLFKTGLFDRHVGIYLGNQYFMHASASKGVTQSRLDNPYWNDKYWKIVRPSNLLQN
ncbi:NlpC/P60 family protein [Neptunomonas japonica]|uniref:Lipoprotein NlpC n=1 Tax=Neptunomonas japonica JAMM 1380 TaxID=1441457 RepID=A0A7R6SX26_9GAMM|nr:NlpC/P60 family protein [Neptunomonas japonica]BBB31090.1 lipoprotein NlpC [Neptunomonas japonica JAMM 1380]